MSKIKIIFCGTPEFAVPLLTALAHDDRVIITGVVTMPDRPAFRGQQLTAPPVAQKAQALNLPLLQTSNLNLEKDWIAQQKQQGVDAVIVAAFAQFLQEDLLNLGRLGAFNFHGSLLPKYRGAAPIQYALLNGDAETGISVQKMAKKMDAGDVVAQQAIPITPADNYASLAAKLSSLAAQMMPSLVEQLLQGNLKGTPQDEGQVSYAPTIKKEMGYLDFAHQGSKTILGQIRAFAQWPKTYCFMNQNRLLIHEAEIYPGVTLAAGEISTNTGYLLIGTSDQTLRLSKIQWANKKATHDQEWLKGIHQPLTLTEAPSCP